MPKVIYKFGDDISTDVVYPGRYMATVLPIETPQYAFADYVDFNKNLNDKNYPEGSFIVADNNFGCGSSREQAASCIKGHGINVIAKDFARIFMQNAINLGLNLIVCPDIEANVDDDIEIKDNLVINKTTGKSFGIEPLPPARQAIIDAGGLIPYTRKKMLEQLKK
ncbi:MAG: 3-isopropylmalate dehydratase [Ignavibacteria bacterium]|nr:3-isopropylmalate dehydratase [Ignavibacteria bacterium]